MSQTNTQKILTRIKGLGQHLQTGEEPIATIPAIWDNGQDDGSALCDVIVTSQRVIGFYFRTFPREKLFFDTLPLAHIENVITRQKAHEPIFQELLLSALGRKIYIRAPRKKIISLEQILKTTLEHNTSPSTSSTNEKSTTTISSTPQHVVYAKQEIQTPLEQSKTTITLLFVGGILLELLGALLWSTTHDAQIGFPLCIAGFVAVAISLRLRRKVKCNDPTTIHNGDTIT
jgi:hypothetical protein